MLLNAQKETINVVYIYTTTILLNSKSSEVKGQSISGTKKNNIPKRFFIIF